MSDGLKSKFLFNGCCGNLPLQKVFVVLFSIVSHRSAWFVQV